MAEQSRIAWTKSTFNPWMGCTKVSPGCEHCYASVSTPARTMGIQWGAGQARIRTSPSNWAKPLVWNKRAQQSGEFWPVFCSSLADVFDNEVPDQWRAALFALIASTPYLTWLLLTKRIGNVASMIQQPGMQKCGLPPNVWLGATIVNQAEADRDIPKLLATPAAKRFVSYEPALGPVDWHLDLTTVAERIRVKTFLENGGDVAFMQSIGCMLDWIIVGGESDQPGMKARPFDVEWARSTVRQCKAHGVPVFVKQLGSAPKNWCAALLNADADHLADCEADHCDNYEAGEQGVICFQAGARCVYLEDRAGADPAEWPEDLRVQEFPL